MMNGRVLCEIFRSPRKEEMYLYIDKRQGLEAVPDALLERFGKPQAVMTLLLDPNKPLARARSADIIAAIREKGFYLQMPPGKEPYMLDLYRTPTEARY